MTRRGAIAACLLSAVGSPLVAQSTLTTSGTTATIAVQPTISLLIDFHRITKLRMVWSNGDSLELDEAQIRAAMEDTP